MDLKKYITDIEDFPIKGVTFRDVTPLLKDKDAYRTCIDELIAYGQQVKADVVIGPEARGFLFGCPVAYGLGMGFVPIRKPGKLPRETVEISYSLEYGKNTLQMHRDAIEKGQRVLIIDDLLATGGTVEATAKIVEELGGVVVGIAFAIELKDLNGRALLKDYDVYSLMTY